MDNTGNDRFHRVSVVFYRLENGSRGNAVFDETMTVGADELVTRNVTFPTVGEHFVVVGLDGEESATHRYEARAENPESAVVIGIEGDGTVVVATFHY